MNDLEIETTDINEFTQQVLNADDLDINLYQVDASSRCLKRVMIGFALVTITLPLVMVLDCLFPRRSWVMDSPSIQVVRIFK